MKQLFAVAGLLAATIAGAQEAATFPSPKSLGSPADWGRNIQRTMTLLATSTPEKRNTVKILFYGQSITEQDWWKEVAGDLRRRFPHANLVIENRAIGGFASQLLDKTAETDLYSFYPDLMVFHVYGSHIEYENIIRRTRQRTTAEILMQTDHVTQDLDLTEETDPAKLRPEGKVWNSGLRGPAAQSRSGLVGGGATRTPRRALPVAVTAEAGAARPARGYPLRAGGLVLLQGGGRAVRRVG